MSLIISLLVMNPGFPSSTRSGSTSNTVSNLISSQAFLLFSGSAPAKSTELMEPIDAPAMAVTLSQIPYSLSASYTPS